MRVSPYVSVSLFLSIVLSVRVSVCVRVSVSVCVSVAFVDTRRSTRNYAVCEARCCRSGVLPLPRGDSHGAHGNQHGSLTVVLRIYVHVPRQCSVNAGKCCRNLTVSVSRCSVSRCAVSRFTYATVALVRRSHLPEAQTTPLEIPESSQILTTLAFNVAKVVHCCSSQSETRDGCCSESESGILRRNDVSMMPILRNRLL